ncbi:unnamed protein product [Closterium sp. NIES-65]|nr:unnamed protein product [Closterium sp. NIES-65]
MLLTRPRSYVARIPLLSSHPPAFPLPLSPEGTSTCSVRASDSERRSCDPLLLSRLKSRPIPYPFRASCRTDPSPATPFPLFSALSISSVLSSHPNPPRCQVERVQTATGVVQVTVCGNRGNPPLITYHDVGLNHSTCFQGLMLCADTSVLLLRNFCIFHVDAPGHEEDAEEIPSSQPLLCADDLAEQVAEVARHFALADVTLMGVTAGAYVLTLFAPSHPRLVQYIFLVPCVPFLPSSFRLPTDPTTATAPAAIPPPSGARAHSRVSSALAALVVRVGAQQGDHERAILLRHDVIHQGLALGSILLPSAACTAVFPLSSASAFPPPSCHRPFPFSSCILSLVPTRRRNLLPGLAALQVPVLVGVGDSSPFNPLARTAFHHLHSKLRPAGSHPWDCCEHAGEDGEERSGYGREWAVGHVEEGASVRWVPTSPLPPPSRLSSPRPPPLPPPPPPLIPPPPSARPSGPLRAPQQLCRLPSHLRLCHLGASWFLRILIEEKVGGGGGGIADGV